jgi:8-oxo-dGTP diphosphatase
MYTYKYPHPAVTADCLVFTRHDSGMNILLIRRNNEPYKDCWAFPGGFMNIDETAEEAAIRELKEETELDLLGNLTQIGAFTKVDRDPRERVLTVAFYAFVDGEKVVNGADDAKEARWFNVNALPPLAFDHQQILETALKMIYRGDELP